jgi:hypothetical protein
MRKIKISTLVAIAVYAMLAIVFTSCEDAGVTSKKLNGDEPNLPDELKGLKIYNVSIGEGNFVKVAVLEERVNSTTYSVGKYQESIVIVNKQNDKLIKVSEILVENDSIIICRK